MIQASVQPQELRIGNLVYSPIHGKIGRLLAIEMGGSPIIDIGEDAPFTTSYSGTDYLRPIPLTPEILIALGFEDMHGEYCPHFRKDHLEIELVEDVFMARVRHSWSEDEQDTSLFLTELSSLHQLQNLYWCLVGKELIYNPNK